MQYINSIDFDNRFRAESIDIDTFDFPKLRVQRWVDILGLGTSYAIVPAADSKWQGTLISVAGEGSESELAGHLQELVDEWNENPKENWLAVLARNLRKCSEYRAREVSSFEKIVEKAATTAASLAKVEAMRAAL